MLEKIIKKDKNEELEKVLEEKAKAEAAKKTEKTEINSEVEK